MQKLYCICGQITFFDTKKPNVCCHCGEPFNKAFKKAVEPIIKQVVKPVKNTKIDDEDDYQDDVEVENIEVAKMKNIAKASAKRVKVNMAKNLTISDLIKQTEKITREQSQINNLGQE